MDFRPELRSMQCYLVLAMAFSSFAICAQDIPHVSAARFWTTGQDTIVELENETFESDLGNFYNSGIVNWTTTGTQASQGTMSAYSHTVVGMLDAILALDITVPPERAATISFFIRTEIALGPDSVNDARVDFLVDGTPVSCDLKDTNWTERKYFMSGGNLLLNWKVYHAQPTSDDTIQVYLDSVLVWYHKQPALKLADGSEGMAKILASDANGNARWSSLSELGHYDNASYNATTPVHLDAQHDEDIPLMVSNGKNSGVQSSSNSGYGFESRDNLTGYFAKNNDVVGFHADLNGIGFHTDSSQAGFYALSANYGFRSQGAHLNGFTAIATGGSPSASYGFWANGSAENGLVAEDNDGNGFRTHLNQGEGLQSENNDEDGGSSSGNGGNGFYAENNYRGYVAYQNNIGFVADSNSGAGFRADNNLTGFRCLGFESLMNNGYGYFAQSNGFRGIYSSLNDGDEGYFSGDVVITGNLSKGSGSFKIDHPLDPENKFLYHSFVESPHMMNIYNGDVILDARGEAIIHMAEWFDALNRDFRYQLTCIGGFAPVYVEEIERNRFRIAGGTPGMIVSWQVTGIRQDPYANYNRIPVEEVKKDEYKGYYLHPEAYGREFERSIDYVDLGHKTLAELMAECTQTDAKSNPK